jgi:dGTPase
MENKNIFSNYKDSLKFLAFNSNDTLGRRFKDDPDSIYSMLDPFFLDREKIRLSKSYRKLASKRQVFPIDSHSNIRNRLIHTNDVVNLSSIYANILGLNVYLAEAIAYGHDIGHSPFGHLGEVFIKQLSGKNFAHNIMSVVVAQKIERSGNGLNLTYETLEGILYHSRGDSFMNINPNITEEANLVMYADKIAYTFSDLNDSLKIGFIKQESLPKIVKYFGRNQRERIANVSFNFIMESAEERKISFSKSECAKNFEELKSWMYENVYYVLNKQGEQIDIFNKLKKINEFIKKRFECKIDPYLAINCMTDNEVSSLAKDIMTINGSINNFNYGFTETINNFFGKYVDIFDPDLFKKDFSK